MQWIVRSIAAVATSLICWVVFPPKDMLMVAIYLFPPGFVASSMIMQSILGTNDPPKKR